MKRTPQQYIIDAGKPSWRSEFGHFEKTVGFDLNGFCAGGEIFCVDVPVTCFLSSFDRNVGFLVRLAGKALVAELYYLLWWKKRISNRDIEDDYSSSTRELFYLLCWKKPTSSSLSSTALNSHTSVRIADSNGHSSDSHLHHSMHSNSGSVDLLLKPFGEDGVETELMRLHNLHGPPRFLFTIKEETKEDLESDDGKSKGDSRKGSRGGSLSDLLLAIETPFLTPLSSPSFFTPPLTPLDNYSQHGFNPLFESSSDAEVSRMRSPPPKFKFLRDAEEKLYKKRLMERALKAHRNDGGLVEDDGMKAPVGPKSSNEEDGSFITILIGKSKEKENHHSSSSQVLPLPSSPSNVKPVCKKPM